MAERLRECQDFINKVNEFRFNKVRQRQINKLNHLVSKKEGNITIANAVNNTTNSVNRQAQAPRNPTLATVLLPPGEGSNSPLATGHLLPEGTGQVIGSHPTQAIAHPPPREGSNSPLATVHLPSEGNSSPYSHAPGILPPREGSNSPPATVHPSSEGNSSPNNQGQSSYSSYCSPSSRGRKQFSPATVHPSLEGNSSPNNQGSLPTLAIAHLPPREGSNSLPGAVHLPSEDVSSSQANVLFPSGEENNSSQATSLHLHTPPQSSRCTQAGQGNNPPRAVRQGNRHQPGISLHSLPRRPVQPPRKATPPPHPPVGPTRVPQMKNPTLSGALTFPTNL